MNTARCNAPEAIAPCGPVRNRTGSVLWKRVPGFTAWLGHYAPGLTNRELVLAIRVRHGVTTTLPSVERLRRSYDLPMTRAARRRAYASRDGRALAPAPSHLRLLVRRITVHSTLCEVVATRVALRS